MSNLLADHEPKVEPYEYFGPGFFKFSFRCPTCDKHRISVVAAVDGSVIPQGECIWKIAGELPAVSIHPSIWQHGHHEDVKDDKGEIVNIRFIDCQWHRCIFKGRFIDELFAWPVEDPANAKFG